MGVSKGMRIRLLCVSTGMRIRWVYRRHDSKVNMCITSLGMCDIFHFILYCNKNQKCITDSHCVIYFV